ncbi:glycosyl transferase [Gordoniibacillus kamchatkensis]|uniref:Glycosyl transferase n=1 Tax=Gordoniibacillus kamchatkensis TaxID=1590651 RepID=A0ABR5ALV7_9BACL|nr:glycosyltransferase [Paenibacillus sp. VKM B-2647]KIL42011.1 glycosyl transferase [Paenibacillus sp. VKM B-2647]
MATVDRLQWFGWLLFGYMALVVCFYTFLFLVSAVQMRRSYRLDSGDLHTMLEDNTYAKPVSILVPAYNEEKGIYASVRSLLSIRYPHYEVIVINDGSKDHTLQTLIEKFQMVPVHKTVRKQLETAPIRAIYRSQIHHHLFAIDKENGGKADALNAGINVSRYPYFCSLDGDSLLEREAFLKVMKPILDADGDVIASGGSVRIANGCRIEAGEVVSVGLPRQPLVVMQVIEYLRAFLIGRIGLSRHNLLLIVSGAFGVFSKAWVVEAGGYRKSSVGEDMELVVRLHRLNKEKKQNKKIVYIPDPVCWTEAPDSLKYLRRQRNRWHRGLFESLWAHRRLIFNPGYGAIGLISMPYFVLIELIAPVIELLAYIFFLIDLLAGGIYVKFAALLFLLLLLYGSLFSMFAVLLEEWSLRKYPKVTDIVKLFLYALGETLWYRPLTVLWRCEGLLQLAIGKRGWGEMKRKGVSA